MSIDNIDEYAFCGTRSGDILEISLTKGIYQRSGPINKKLKGCVNQVLSKKKNIYVGTSDGIVAKLDKTSLNIIGEVKINYSSINGLAQSESKVYNYSDRGVVRAVLDSESLQQMQVFLNSHFDVVSSVAFPQNYSNVFGTASQDEVRLWSPNNQKELLRIELMQGSEYDFAKANCLDFMPDGKSIVSGWTDGKIRAFLPQSGKLYWIINDAH